MTIHRKTTEHLQAQLADYADALKSPQHEFVYENIGKLALLGMYGGEDDQEYASYTCRLREISPELRVSQPERASLVENYKGYRQTVKEYLDNGDRDRFLLLGKGAHSHAYKFLHGGRQMVLRVPYRSEYGHLSSAVNEYITAGVRGQGVAHLEQFVAASYEDGVSISEFVPGCVIADLTPDMCQRVSPGQVTELIEAVTIGFDRGLDFDGHGHNVIYDDTNGFTAIDYIVADQHVRSPKREAIESVMRMFDMEQASEDPHDFVLYASEQRCASSAILLEKLWAVVDDHLDGRIANSLKTRIIDLANAYHNVAEDTFQDGSHQSTASFL